MRKYLSIILVLLLVFSLFTACGGNDDNQAYQVPEELTAMYDEFLAAADPTFAYDVAFELSQNPELWSTPDLGGRNAGSEAEHAAAEYLTTVMADIGLTDIEKVGAQCDMWSNNGSTFTIGDTDYPVYAYPCKGTPPAGVTSDLVYVSKGTMWDYEDLDVTGKIVLVDIDQRADWWITYPMLEAEYQGAVGIIAANTGGFAEIAGDALNCNDICAPISIPTVSISLDDALAIQGQLEAGPLKATLTVDNDISVDTGVTYNVLGKIPGKSSENQIIVGGHYDMHFYGFQDDNCAVGLVLAMAKAMVDSGYVPENDIVFCLHGAEEWGSFGTQYDWTIGAWEMINTQHPEWVGKTLAFINFELPAFQFADYTYTASAPETYSMMDFFANTYPLSPKPVDCFPEGMLTEGYQNYTYSDDFSYYVAGVPSFVNGFLFTDSGDDVYDYYYQIYHSNYDLPDTYNEAVMDFNLKYYGAFAMFVDQMPALYIDYTGQYDRIMESIDEEVMAAAGVDMDAYYGALEKLKGNAGLLRDDVKATNDAYIAAYIDGDETAMAEMWEKGKALTAKNLDAFKFSQEAFVGLMYERPIVRHEAPQENIQLMSKINEALAEGDVVTAADEYSWQVNNLLEWYTTYFSPAVLKINDDMLWSEENQYNNYWGIGRSFVPASVGDASMSLYLRYDDVGGDFSKEIAIYKAAIDVQSKVLKKLGEQEITDMGKLADMLEI